MGIEPTTRVGQVTGFEDQGSHQTSFTSNIWGQSKNTVSFFKQFFYREIPKPQVDQVTGRGSSALQPGAATQQPGVSHP